MSRLRFDSAIRRIKPFVTSAERLSGPIELPSGRVIRLLRGIEFACPFCGKDCQAGYNNLDDAPTIWHALPACETYTKLDAVPFLEAVQKAVYRPN